MCITAYNIFDQELNGSKSMRVLINTDIFLLCNQGLYIGGCAIVEEITECKRLAPKATTSRPDCQEGPTRKSICQGGPGAHQMGNLNGLGYPSILSHIL